MNSIERFYATIERKPVDRPACWLGDPTLDAVPALCDYYGVKDIKELKRVCGDDFYAVEIPYHSETCNAIFAAFDSCISATLTEAFRWSSSRTYSTGYLNPAFWKS